MTVQNITLPLPEHLYLRFEQIAKATQQSMTDVLLHAVELGRPAAPGRSHRSRIAMALVPRSHLQVPAATRPSSLRLHEV